MLGIVVNTFLSLEKWKSRTSFIKNPEPRFIAIQPLTVEYKQTKRPVPAITPPLDLRI
jgi:hypothetical protein